MKTDTLLAELTYKAVRSSGAGGQNVNKVSSKVVLTFDLTNTLAFTDAEKERLQTKLAKKLSSENLLILTCDEDRSQRKNKELVTKRFLALIEKTLVVPKKRKETQVPTAVKEKRIKDKKTISEVKQNRKKPDF
ncbi:alternative ribosome rescue aminoacyl-tRNA hydrolase ArfB [Flavobacterium capsici]|uniref:Alternative ribosome rescue aminoacyl-tRNA hydrolase ArfB n=1 Tax=Flavobacterium capsici TaxID=3075618 RepID=A0AA96EYA0_9FLAO|nr:MULTISPECIES: alternative ribosome rescue aminoacyl-tRNA hydrolase ArfB [unclassified Flavobacterium]WNM19394.1 alternative ribosome rescue aminoacyl-tRNA hydrolase ArfB [Flavobacterium sp. PMR2A8]WNM20784.1 alternative ribosome rescue aminoacyl-tRNA hydrolase ArfB [Flavobacterium sp. PMTSA4]